jgi:hypothetical protein
MQVRNRHLHRQHLVAQSFVVQSAARVRCFLEIAGRLPRPFGGAFDPADDAVRVSTFRSTQLFDRRLHSRLCMTRQQLQHTHVLTHAGADAMPLFQPPTQFQKDRRQLPVPIHVRVIQRGRPTLQRRQIMPRVEHLVAGGVTPRVSRHDRVLMHDLNPVDIALDRHRLERAVTRDAVTHVVESRELILVDFHVLMQAGVEPTLRQ